MKIDTLLRFRNTQIATFYGKTEAGYVVENCGKHGET